MRCQPASGLTTWGHKLVGPGGLTTWPQAGRTRRTYEPMEDLWTYGGPGGPMMLEWTCCGAVWPRHSLPCSPPMVPLAPPPTWCPFGPGWPCPCPCLLSPPLAPARVRPGLPQAPRTLPASPGPGGQDDGDKGGEILLTRTRERGGEPKLVLQYCRDFNN